MAQLNQSEEHGVLTSTFEVEVYYEDTDLSGFVYHANYFKFFERAREHTIGRDYLKRMLDSKLHFVVSKADIRYLAPARFGDTLIIKSVGSYSRSPVIEFKQQVFVKSAPPVLGGRPIVEAGITLVILDENNRPIRMPDSVIEHFVSQQLVNDRTSVT
jgi:acyl-CoA thioester hydrolase